LAYQQSRAEQSRAEQSRAALEPPWEGGKVSAVNLPISILLKDQIVKGIQLEKLGLYKANNNKINGILKGLRPTRISNIASWGAGYINLFY
jgi:hypothetical protein